MSPVPPAEIPDAGKVVDPRGWNVPLVLMVAITGMLLAGAVKLTMLWSKLDARLASIENSMEVNGREVMAVSDKLDGMMTKRAFSDWSADTAERNTGWKPARTP